MVHRHRHRTAHKGARARNSLAITNGDTLDANLTRRQKAACRCHSHCHSHKDREPCLDLLNIGLGHAREQRHSGVLYMHRREVGEERGVSQAPLRRLPTESMRSRVRGAGFAAPPRARGPTAAAHRPPFDVVHRDRLAEPGRWAAGAPPDSAHGGTAEAPRRGRRRGRRRGERRGERRDERRVGGGLSGGFRSLRSRPSRRL